MDKIFHKTPHDLLAAALWEIAGLSTLGMLATWVHDLPCYDYGSVDCSEPFRQPVDDPPTPIFILDPKQCNADGPCPFSEYQAWIPSEVFSGLEQTRAQNDDQALLWYALHQGFIQDAKESSGPYNPALSPFETTRWYWGSYQTGRSYHASDVTNASIPYILNFSISSDGFDVTRAMSAPQFHDGVGFAVSNSAPSPMPITDGFQMPDPKIAEEGLCSYHNATSAIPRDALLAGGIEKHGLTQGILLETVRGLGDLMTDQGCD